MNSQNQIRLHKIGRKDRNFPISPSNFMQSDLILAVRVNARLLLPSTFQPTTSNSKTSFSNIFCFSISNLKHQHWSINKLPFVLRPSSKIDNLFELSIEGFVKISKIGTVTIPDRQKTIRTVSWWYLHDTGIVLAAILDALSIPRWYRPIPGLSDTVCESLSYFTILVKLSLEPLKFFIILHS